MCMKKMAVLVLALTMLLALCGCPDKNEESRNGEDSVSIAVVSGYRANCPLPPYNSLTVSNAIMDSAVSYGKVTIIVADGMPYAMADFAIAPPERDLSSTKRRDIAKAQTQQIVQTISNAKAQTAEADVLAAINLAARSLSNAEGERVLLVLDSGLATTGYINFTNNLLRATNTQAIVTYLEETKLLPDLSGIDVLWVGLGDTCGKQQPLTPSNRETLKAIWNDALLAAGAQSVFFSDDLPGSAPTDDEKLPPVSPVMIYGDPGFVIAEEVAAQEEDTPIFDEPILVEEEMDDGKVLFLPDTAVLADPDAAMDALKPISEVLIAHPEVRIVLAGTTASAGTKEACERLSCERAGTVRQVLLDLGVGNEQIAGIYGLGYDNAFHVPDKNPDGSLNENAPANRAVIILNVDSKYMSLIEGAPGNAI